LPLFQNNLIKTARLANQVSLLGITSKLNRGEYFFLTGFKWTCSINIKTNFVFIKVCKLHMESSRCVSLKTQI
jgi:hypothetical protein